MKKLGNFFLDEVQSGKQSGLVYEYRTKKQVDQIKAEQDVTLNKVQGVPAEKNISGGVWAVDEPTEDDITKGINKFTIICKRICACGYASIY